MGRRKPLGITIAVGNQKGGVGKTTNTVHIAAALGQRRYRCLIIDLDPASGATKHLGVPENSFAGSLELLTTDETVESLAITEKLPRGVHLVPSRPQLSELDTLLSKYVDRTQVLGPALAASRSRYDFIFLDTAPSAAATTTVAAYSSAEWFLLSAFPHPLSLGGLTEAFNDIADVRRHRNPDLQVLGVIFTNVDRRATRLRAQLEAVVNEALPGRRFETSISQAVILPEVSGKGKTLFQLPRHDQLNVARQYLRLAHEVEHRVLNREAFVQGMLAPRYLRRRSKRRKKVTKTCRLSRQTSEATLMAKPLREPPPTSSVARLLDLGAAARAIASPSPLESTEAPTRLATVPPPLLAVQTGESASIKREFVLTESATTTVDSLIDNFRKATGARVGASHVIRAVLLAIEHAMPLVDAETRKVGPMKLPSNARGREADRERFERRMAEAIGAGMRAAATMVRSE